MKKAINNQGKKLGLNKQTIAKLNNIELLNLKGGQVGLIASENGHCTSEDQRNCPTKPTTNNSANMCQRTV